MPVIQLGGPPQLAGGFGPLMGNPQTLAATLKLRAAEQRRQEWAAATQQIGADWQRTMTTMAGWQQQQRMEEMRQQGWQDREQYRQQAYAARQQLQAMIKAQQEQAEADYEEFGMSPEGMASVQQQQGLSDPEETRRFLRAYEAHEPEYIEADRQKIGQEIYAIENAKRKGEITPEEAAPLLQQKYQERGELLRTPQLYRKRQEPTKQEILDKMTVPLPDGSGWWVIENTRYGPRIKIQEAPEPGGIDRSLLSVDETVQRQLKGMSESQWKGVLNDASKELMTATATEPFPSAPSQQAVRERGLEILRKREQARRWTEGEIELGKVERELKAHPRYDFSDRLPAELVGDDQQKARLDWAEWTIQDLHKRYESADQMPPEDRKRFDEAVAIWERSQK